MKRAIFFVLASVIEASLFSQNLVQNPGFETWSAAGRPTKWSNAAGCSKDSVIVKSAPYSCRQVTTTSSKDLGQKIPVDVGKKYSLSFFYNTDSTRKGNGCRIWSSWLNDTLGIIDDPSSETILHSGSMKSETWQLFSIDITAPDSAAYFYLLVRTLPKSLTYWDDFVFEESVITYSSEEQLSDVVIYPNPAHDYLIISNLQNMQHIDIQNLAGQVVWSGDFAGESTATLPVSSLGNGLYLLRIRTAEKQITRKFIKLAY